MRRSTLSVDAVRRSDAWRFASNLPLLIGTLGLLTIAALALFGPQLAPGDPHAQRVVIFYPDGTFAAPPTPPDGYNLLGTDPIGRDQFSRLLWGARLTVSVVLLALLGRATLAITFGVLAGSKRGSWLDLAIQQVTDAIGGFPQLMLALLAVLVLQDWGVGGFIAALSLVGWAELARFIRAEVVRIDDTPHVQAARALGASRLHLLRAHVFRDLTPQLVGLVAVEAGSVLLLLAELGFIGLFISGGIFFTSDAGVPVLPVRDRAPEWGQMLAGARNYAFAHQYVAFVPGVVVVGTVLTFNLFAEGLRSAADPFSARRMSPRSLGSLARALALAAVVSTLVFGYITLHSSSLSFNDGLREASQLAAKSFPDGRLIGAAVRHSASAHALSRPERLTYYFADDRSRLFRVTFLDADANAVDAKLSANDDGLALEMLRPIETAGLVTLDEAVRFAEERAGARFRSQDSTYSLRVLLLHETGTERPVYRVQYSRGGGPPLLEIRVDAVTGRAASPPPQRP